MASPIYNTPEDVLNDNPGLRDLIKKNKSHLQTDKGCGEFINYLIAEDAEDLAADLAKFCILVGIDVTPYVNVEDGSGLFYRVSFKSLGFKATILSQEVTHNTFADSDLILADIKNAEIIYPYAFDGCQNLQHVVAPKVEKVCTNAFNECTKLISIKLPNCQVVETYTFWGCKNLERIELPNCNPKNIHFNAFQNCPNLTEIGLSYKECKNAFPYDDKKIDKELIHCKQKWLDESDVSDINIKFI